MTNTTTQRTAARVLSNILALLKRLPKEEAMFRNFSSEIESPDGGRFHASGLTLRGGSVQIIGSVVEEGLMPHDNDRLELDDGFSVPTLRILRERLRYELDHPRVENFAHEAVLSVEEAQRLYAALSKHGEADLCHLIACKCGVDNATVSKYKSP